MDAPIEEKEGFTKKFSWPIDKLQKSKFLHRYGYFECRCKLQKKAGWWSAFWLQSPIQGATLSPETSGAEVDIMESFKPGLLHPHYVHYLGCGEDYKFEKTGGDFEVDINAWHTFGVLWEKDKYTFYVDGKEDEIITDGVSQIPLFILLTTEVFGYRDSDEPTDEAKETLGDTFLVDYVRVFDFK